jgi:hypothetical protein
MTATIDRNIALHAHISNAGFKGYANQKTLSRAMSIFADRLRRDGFEDLYEVHQIKAGPNAGRWVGLLVLGPREQMTQELCLYVQQGLPVYRHRAPAHIPPA